MTSTQPTLLIYNNKFHLQSIFIIKAKVDISLYSPAAMDSYSFIKVALLESLGIFGRLCSNVTKIPFCGFRHLRVAKVSLI